ncbi:hypothetical protein [Teredinibacter turnerae]|uniref:hypothetical protein n=1 Tax=Teredinibacter turnerae TaxID=2426 RepID=UPI0003777AA5|nr:hypothetical protein [Teredinibacter turnerae]
MGNAKAAQLGERNTSGVEAAGVPGSVDPARLHQNEKPAYVAGFFVSVIRLFAGVIVPFVALLEAQTQLSWESATLAVLRRPAIRAASIPLGSTKTKSLLM